MWSLKMQSRHLENPGVNVYPSQLSACDQITEADDNTEAEQGLRGSIVTVLGYKSVAHKQLFHVCDDLEM